jgi:hypothetical protein
MSSLTKAVIRVIGNILWMLLWLMGGITLFGDERAPWFSYLCFAMAVLPIAWEGYCYYREKG